MPIQHSVTMSLSATGYSPWLITTDAGETMVQMIVPVTGAPVGVWTIEGSNDVSTIKAEMMAGVPPASGTVTGIDCTAAVTVYGAALNAYDGLAEYTSMWQLWPTPGALRVKWTRTSGTGTARVIMNCR